MECVDQMGRAITLDKHPRRIISIVPSQTELLYHLGLKEEVVGITKFCIHPDEWFRSKQRIGGTKNLKIEEIRALKPDLIIGNKEENAIDDILALEKEFPVWMSDIFDLEDAYNMMTSIGDITGKAAEVKQLIGTVKSGFSELSKKVGSLKSVLYFIWNEPAMLAGTNTFISKMLEACGMKNLAEGRYPEATFEESPDLVLLSSEPFPFKENHKEAFEERYPKSQVMLVDGEMFSWYGSRLREAPKYFQNLLESI